MIAAHALKTIPELLIDWPVQLEQRYSPVSVISRGGFGVVVLAVERSTGRRVAVKLINREHGQDPVITLRFLAEARIVAGLSHPNVLRLLEYGVDGEQPFIVMPLVEGTSLREELRRGGPFPWRSAVELVCQIAAGLGAIHRAGVVHRDLKPENVMAYAGTALIIDFGISKSGQTGVRTAAGVILGTPGYIAPEAVREEPVTGGSDIYALGVTFFELLTGVRPLQRVDAEDPTSTRTRMEELLAMRDVTPPPPSVLAPDCPRWVDALVERMLATNPLERPMWSGVAEEITRRLRPRTTEQTIRSLPAMVS